MPTSSSVSQGCFIPHVAITTTIITTRQLAAATREYTTADSRNVTSSVKGKTVTIGDILGVKTPPE